MKREVRVLLLSFFACLMFLSIMMLFSWYLENRNVQKIVKEVKKYVVEEKNDSIYLDKSILNVNSETVGWISIEGTNINYPVVRHVDNDYYLRHDFQGQRNSAGWVFMDYRNQLDDQNLVIYGHHRRDGSMFGSINLLFDSNFYKEYGNIITFITEDHVFKYQIFSVYKASSTDSYNSPNFDSLSEAVEKMKKRSEIYFEENLENASQILTLSTCHDNDRDRLVVHGAIILN